MLVAMVLAVAGLAGYWCIRGSLNTEGTRRITAVINSQPLVVVSLNRSNGEVMVIKIPGNTMISVSGGYGQYPAVSVWALAKQEGHGTGLVTRSFREFLGIPIDLAVDVGGEVLSDNDETELVKDSQRIVWECMVGKRGCGEVDKIKLMGIWLATRKIAPGKVVYLPIESMPGTKTDQLPDGLSILEADINGIDLFVSRYAVDERIKNEGLAIGVYNAAGYPGLATKASRILTNLGGRVLVVEDWEERLSSCELRSAEDVRVSFTYRLVKDVFDCRDGKVNGEDEVDLTVLIGEGYPGGT